MATRSYMVLIAVAGGELVLGAVFAAIAVASGGDSTLVIVGPMMLVGALVLLALGLRWRGRAREAKEIERLGVEGEATVVSVHETGVRVNGVPMLKLELDVEGPAGIERVAKRELVPEGVRAWLKEGSTLPVKVHPSRPGKIAIAWDEAEEHVHDYDEWKGFDDAAAGETT